jgi:hypothetical protein
LVHIIQIFEFHSKEWIEFYHFVASLSFTALAFRPLFWLKEVRALSGKKLFG